MVEIRTTSPISDGIPTQVIQPAEGEGIPGEVNIEWYKTALEALLPDRFHSVRTLHDKCRHDESPLLLAHDKQGKCDVMLQLFTSKEEYQRLSECATRCCKLRRNATIGGMHEPPSPGSPSSRSEPMICDVVAISGDPKQLQWCAILETGSETLDAMIRKRGQLDKGEVRQAFIRVARGVQALHRAGLVHNAVCAQNVIRVSSGVKLGNYAALQRQSEKQRQGGPGHTLCSPERALAESSHTTLTCDFATDVWCLGLLLYELVTGVAWDAGRPYSEVSQELLGSDVVPLPALGTSDEENEIRCLLERMLAKHPMQRPVVDVVVQDAIAKLYLAHEIEPPPKSPISPVRRQPPASPSPSPLRQRGVCESDHHTATPTGDTTPLPAKASADQDDCEPVTSSKSASCACRCAIM